jgi:hypothetical protein
LSGRDGAVTPLLRWQADGTVNADYLTVQHPVIHDMQDRRRPQPQRVDRAEQLDLDDALDAAALSTAVSTSAEVVTSVTAAIPPTSSATWLA